MNYKKFETDQNQRTENVIVRLTLEEKHILVREAQKLGISISALVRLLLRNWTNGIKFEKNGK
jgi:hypothetical protein